VRVLGVIKKFRGGFASLVAASLIFAQTAQADWGLTVLAAIASFAVGRVTAPHEVKTTAQVNIDLSELRADLRKGFLGLRAELKEISSAIDDSAHTAASIESFLKLPLGKRFSNGSNTIEFSKVEKLYKELLQGLSDTARELRLSFRDMMLILTLVDLKPFVLEADFFESVLAKHQTMNQQDRISSTDNHLSVLAAVAAYAQIRTAFEERATGKSIVINPVLDAVDVYFSTLLQTKFGEILGAAVQGVEESEQVEYLAMLTGDVISLHLDDNPEIAAQQVHELLKGGNRLVDFERVENLLLTVAAILNSDTSRAVIADADLALSRLLAEHYSALFKERSRSIGASKANVERGRKSVAKDIEAERHEIRQGHDSKSVVLELITSWYTRLALTVGAMLTGEFAFFNYLKTDTWGELQTATASVAAAALASIIIWRVKLRSWKRRAAQYNGSVAQADYLEVISVREIATRKAQLERLERAAERLGLVKSRVANCALFASGRSAK